MPRASPTAPAALCCACRLAAAAPCALLDPHCHGLLLAVSSTATTTAAATNSTAAAAAIQQYMTEFTRCYTPPQTAKPVILDGILAAPRQQSRQRCPGVAMRRLQGHQGGVFIIPPVSAADAGV